MNEFSLIDTFFKAEALARDDVLVGIGDDAACLRVPADCDLLVSTDTLVSGVHFPSDCKPWDIGWKAVMVNVSDMAAMAAKPCWLSLALTLPSLDLQWLEQFSAGLHAALKYYSIALIGGDTTHGPLSITITIHGLAPAGRAVRRNTAKAGDTIWVSGELGAAAQAVALLQSNQKSAEIDRKILLDKLNHPQPRIDLLPLIRDFASAAIDISDGLAADLGHIAHQSQLGATLFKDAVPVHPLVKKFQHDQAVNFALTGGDDYELCFTVSPSQLESFIRESAQNNLQCVQIGKMEFAKGLRLADKEGVISPLTAKGYTHF